MFVFHGSLSFQTGISFCEKKNVFLDQKRTGLVHICFCSSGVFPDIFVKSQKRDVKSTRWEKCQKILSLCWHHRFSPRSTCPGFTRLDGSIHLLGSKIAISNPWKYGGIPSEVHFLSATDNHFQAWTNLQTTTSGSAWAHPGSRGPIILEVVRRAPYTLFPYPPWSSRVYTPTSLGVLIHSDAMLVKKRTRWQRLSCRRGETHECNF